MVLKLKSIRIIKIRLIKIENVLCVVVLDTPSLTVLFFEMLIKSNRPTFVCRVPFLISPSFSKRIVDTVTLVPLMQLVYIIFNIFLLYNNHF